MWRLTAEEPHGAGVLLGEMFQRRLHHLREVEHGDEGGRVRLRHLPGQSPSASWELFRRNRVSVQSWNVTSTFAQLMYKCEVLLC